MQSPSPFTRLPHWPEALAAHIQARRHTPFAWGTHDCCTFAADGVRAMTGVCPMPDLRGLGARAARAVLRATPLADLVTQRLGAPLAHPAQAQRGDVLLVQAPGHPLWLALCDGALWWAPGAQGLVSGPTATALAAWPVGRAHPAQPAHWVGEA